MLAQWVALVNAGVVKSDKADEQHIPRVLGMPSEVEQVAFAEKAGGGRCIEKRARIEDLRAIFAETEPELAAVLACAATAIVNEVKSKVPENGKLSADQIVKLKPSTAVMTKLRGQVDVLLRGAYARGASKALDEIEAGPCGARRVRAHALDVALRTSLGRDSGQIPVDPVRRTSVLRHRQAATRRSQADSGVRPRVPPRRTVPMSGWNESRDGHRHTVLLVEDYDDARSALVMLLELAGCEVASVADGAEAVAWLQNGGFRPCVILLDLILPKMDGFTFHDWQQQSPGLDTIPAIALTGHEGMRRHALDKGFTAALLKPASIEDICALLGKHCNGRRDG